MGIESASDLLAIVVISVLFHCAIFVETSEAVFIRNIREYSTTNQSFRLTLSDKIWEGPHFETSWVKYPFTVTVGNLLYAQIQMVQPAADDDLKAYAKECFYSKNSDPLIEPKSKILTSGCPVTMKSGSVNVHHTRSLPVSRYTRLSFPLERIYFDSNYMYFHCKVVACSLRGGREHDGYETCPNSTSCTDRTIDSQYVPMESPYSYVSSGLMRPVRKPESSNEGKAATCPPCPTSGDTLPTAAEPQQAADVTTSNGGGVSVPTVIGIGVCSFVIGLFLMGGLWYVHEHTEPKKYLNSKRRNSDRDSSSFLSTQTPDACTPMTKNLTGRSETEGGGGGVAVSVAPHQLA